MEFFYRNWIIFGWDVPMSGTFIISSPAMKLIDNLECEWSRTSEWVLPKTCLDIICAGMIKSTKNLKDKYDHISE